MRRAQTDVAYRRFLRCTLSGALQLPAPFHRGNDRGGVSMDIGGGGQRGGVDPGGGIYRWDAHQSQRKSEEENETGSIGSGKTIPRGAAGGGECGLGSPREKGRLQNGGQKHHRLGLRSVYEGEAPAAGWPAVFSWNLTASDQKFVISSIFKQALMPLSWTRKKKRQKATGFRR